MISSLARENSVSVSVTVTPAPWAETAKARDSESLSRVFMGVASRKGRKAAKDLPSRPLRPLREAKKSFRTVVDLQSHVVVEDAVVDRAGGDDDLERVGAGLEERAVECQLAFIPESLPAMPRDCAVVLAESDFADGLIIHGDVELAGGGPTESEA